MYAEVLQKCWLEDPVARPTFGKLQDDLKAVGSSLGIWPDPEQSAGDTRLSAPRKVLELDPDGLDAYYKDDLEAFANVQDSYLKFLALQRLADEMMRYHQFESIESSITSSDDYARLHADEQVKKRFQAVLQTMEIHFDRYLSITTGWFTDAASRAAFDELGRAHSEITQSDPPVLQPTVSGVASTSKHYLGEMLATFSKMLDDGSAFAGCKNISTELGVEWQQGPLKEPVRILEKALGRGNRFNEVRDFARGCFIVDDLGDLARILRRINTGDEYTIVRAKNKFDDDAFDPQESNGYRDYQLIVELAGGAGHLLEVQLIPRDLYEVKSELGNDSVDVEGLDAPLTGHDAYKEYRVIKEAKLRMLKRAHTPARMASRTLSIERDFRLKRAARLDEHRRAISIATGDAGRTETLERPPLPVVRDGFARRQAGNRSLMTSNGVMPSISAVNRHASGNKVAPER